MDKAYRTVRKIAVAVVGFSIIIVGVALLVLPGPGILVIIAGLAVLAIEFTWAERHLKTLRTRAGQVAKKARRKKKPNRNT